MRTGGTGGTCAQGADTFSNTFAIHEKEATNHITFHFGAIDIHNIKHINWLLQSLCINDSTIKHNIQ